MPPPEGGSGNASKFHENVYEQRDFACFRAFFGDPLSHRREAPAVWSNPTFPNRLFFLIEAFDFFIILKVFFDRRGHFWLTKKNFGSFEI